MILPVLSQLWECDTLGKCLPMLNSSPPPTKKKSFLFLIHVLEAIIPKEKAPGFRLFGFSRRYVVPQENPKINTRKTTFGCLCGKPWSLLDFPCSQKRKRKKESCEVVRQRRWELTGMEKVGNRWIWWYIRKIRTDGEGCIVNPDPCECYRYFQCTNHVWF